jgi:uncharacterized protein YjbJ (UPF0337 family)
MNKDIVEGNWKQLRGMVIALWGNLTDDPQLVLSGERVDLAGRLQESYGVSTDEAAQQIRAFALNSTRITG